MYTMEEFITDCINLKNEEIVSYTVDATHILVGLGYEDCIEIELNLGYDTPDEGNVCEQILENCCIDYNNKSEIPNAIEYLIKCI